MRDNIEVPVSLKVSEQVMDKMNFKHYMLKEIYDQPETAKNWLRKLFN